jgi:surfactin synthase thioesterase subunit
MPSLRRLSKRSFATMNVESCRVRLLCFSYAGGAAATFSDFADQFPDHIGCIAIEYPGHGSNRSEPPISDIGELSRILLPEIVHWAARPSAIVGVSMGALVGFEILQRICRAHIPSQIGYFFPIAHRAPHIPLARKRILHNLPDEEFVSAVRSLTQSRHEILNDKSLWPVLLPSLRADFKACEVYASEGPITLRIPITAIGGTADSAVRAEELNEWLLYSQVQAHVQMIPSGHFAHEDNPGDLARLITDALSRA